MQRKCLQTASAYGDFVPTLRTGASFGPHRGTSVQTPQMNIPLYCHCLVAKNASAVDCLEYIIVSKVTYKL